MLQDISTQADAVINAIRSNLPLVIMMVGILYLIHLFNWFIGYKLNILGILPRRLWGLLGIIFSPFLHGNFNHLFFNSIPFVILASLLLLYGWPIFIFVTVFVAFFGGLGTWFFARRGLHIGASGVIMGYWSYLLVNAYYQPSWLSIVLAIVCVYYFGSFIFHIVPTAERSSWEAHLFGLLAGIGAAFALPFCLPWIMEFIAMCSGFCVA